MAKLTPKQLAFVKEYIIDLNASAACLRSGYKSKNPDVDGHRLLVNPSIKVAIEQAMVERSKRTEITADMVLKEYAKIGFADIKDYLSFRTAQTIVDRDNEGKPIVDYAMVIDLKDSDQVDGAAISEVTLKDGTLKFKLHDKKGALDSMARHLGMFTDKLEVSGYMTIEQLLEDLD